VPTRLGVAGLIGLALIAGLAFAECERLLVGRSRTLAALARSTGLGLLVAVAMYGSYSTRGGQLVARRTPMPRAYHLARAIDGRSPLIAIIRQLGGPLVELPVARVQIALFPGDGPTDQAQAMYRSIFHWQPLVNGYSSYWPVGFPERMTLAYRLPDPDALAELSRETGLHLVLVHTASLTADARAAWNERSERASAGLELVARDGEDLLFRVVGDELPEPSGKPRGRGRRP
jgi:hypothetical protein